VLGREHRRHSAPRLRQRLEAPDKLAPQPGLEKDDVEVENP
jgi:hypothetical protein